MEITTGTWVFIFFIGIFFALFFGLGENANKSKDNEEKDNNKNG
jgi:hypothetical protein